MLPSSDCSMWTSSRQESRVSTLSSPAVFVLLVVADLGVSSLSLGLSLALCRKVRIVVSSLFLLFVVSFTDFSCCS